jgi:transcriptional regulator with XRE-family HTH domain
MNVPRLRELREQRLMTQGELAAKAGLTHATISRLETGKHRPYFSTIRKLAGALGVRPQVLAEKGK